MDSPDPQIFEQAIFIVRNDAFGKAGVTPEQIVSEACRVARGYTAAHGGHPRGALRVPPGGFIFSLGARGTGRVARGYPAAHGGPRRRSWRGLPAVCYSALGAGAIGLVWLLVSLL